MPDSWAHKVTTPLISIVICCHNRAHFLPQTLDSAFSQHYKPVEILVFDDGSTDNTSELIASYGDAVKYVRQENQGISVARTNACKVAKGEYIAFLDDDDLMPPDRINTLYNALFEYPSAVFSVGDIAIIDGDNNFTGHRWLPKGKLSTKDPVLIEDGFEAVAWPIVPATLHSTLFRKSDAKKIGWFDPQYKIASEDKDFLARLGQLGPIVYIPEVVSYYRRGHSSLTNKNISARFSKLTLLSNQLHSLTPSQKRLKKRLQRRILMRLKRIARLRAKGIAHPDTVPYNFINTMLSLLNMKDRILYWRYVHVVLPIKKLLHHNIRD